MYEYTSAYTDLLAYIKDSVFGDADEVSGLTQQDYRIVTVNGHTYTTVECSFANLIGGLGYALFAEEKKPDGCNLYCWLGVKTKKDDAWMQDTLFGGLQYYREGFGWIEAAASEADILLRTIGDDDHAPAGTMAIPGDLLGNDLMGVDYTYIIQNYYTERSVLYNTPYEKAIFTYFEQEDGAKLLKELEDDQNLRFIDIYEDVQAGEITKQTYRGKDVYVQYLTYKPYGTSWGYVYDSRPCTEVRMARKINGHTLVAQYIGLDELTGIQEQDLEDILDRFWSWDDNPADSTETEP